MRASPSGSPEPTSTTIRSPIEIALFETAEGGTSRMLMCKGIHSKGGETGRVFGEKGWMDGTEYRGTMKDLPDISNDRHFRPT